MSKDVITLLDVPFGPRQTVPVAPAHGQVFQAPQATIGELRIGGLHLTAVTDLVLDFPSILKIDGVLGMNILRQFRMTLEPDTATLVLRRLAVR